MSDTFLSTLGGVVAGLAIWGFISLFIIFSDKLLVVSDLSIKDAKELIQECEIELPRRQTCTLIAVPRGSLND